MAQKAGLKKAAKIKIGVLYGGRSGEHDVSLCSAASVFSALDRNKYEVTAIGIDRDGRWYVQDKPEIISDKDFGRNTGFEKEGHVAGQSFRAEKQTASLQYQKQK